MPGISRFTVDGAVAEARELFGLGIRSVAALRNSEPQGRRRLEQLRSRSGVVHRAARAIAAALPEMLLVADLCNCEYTDHGHCGILDARGDVDNDATVELLARTAVTLCRSRH